MDDGVRDTIALLERTPGALRALLQGLPAGWLHPFEGEGTFGPVEIVGHLIHGEQTDWIPRLRHILEHGETRPFAPFDRVGFADHIRGRALPDLLDEFQALRTQSLAALQAVNPGAEELRLIGLHPELGRVTLAQLLSTWAVHDLNHLGQLARVMSRRYAEAVGPWKAYLGILNR
jgi:hypothetical protein